MKTTIADIHKKYSGKIDRLDLELIIAHAIGKPREFVLSHPEHAISKMKLENCELKIARRMRDEPLAYILGSREFFGLPFLVSPATLIPRPETELMVEMAMRGNVPTTIGDERCPTSIIDVGTGSGNIIISIARTMDSFRDDFRTCGTNLRFYGIDISEEALTIAKKNAGRNRVGRKIKFFHGNLLEPMIENNILDPLTGRKNCNRVIILANLPYLSKEIYGATLPTVKKFEPRSALYSPKDGLSHYEKLLQQIGKMRDTYDISRITCYMEISPEQKTKLSPLIKKYLPAAIIGFEKDLAQKWRICTITV